MDANDNIAYAKAFYEFEPRRLKVATEIEDIIFDHFGIIEMQYEASAHNLRMDMDYQVKKIQMQAELARGLQDGKEALEENKKELTLEKA